MTAAAVLAGRQANAPPRNIEGPHTRFVTPPAPLRHLLVLTHFL